MSNIAVLEMERELAKQELHAIVEDALLNDGIVSEYLNGARLNLVCEIVSHTMVKTLEHATIQQARREMRKKEPFLIPKPSDFFIKGGRGSYLNPYTVVKRARGKNKGGTGRKSMKGRNHQGQFVNKG